MKANVLRKATVNTTEWLKSILKGGRCIRAQERIGTQKVVIYRYKMGMEPKNEANGSETVEMVSQRQSAMEKVKK